MFGPICDIRLRMRRGKGRQSRSGALERDDLSVVAFCNSRMNPAPVEGLVDLKVVHYES